MHWLVHSSALVLGGGGGRLGGGGGAGGREGNSKHMLSLFLSSMYIFVQGCLVHACAVLAESACAIVPRHRVCTYCVLVHWAQCTLFLTMS